MEKRSNAPTANVKSASKKFDKKSSKKEKFDRIVYSDEFHQAKISLLGPRNGYWTQALVQHRKETAPDGTRVLIIKKFGKVKVQ